MTTQSINVNTAPYSAIGLLAFETNGSWTFGAGALIGGQQVVTYASNFYSPSASATQICFYPAWNAAFPTPPGGTAAAAAFYPAAYGQAQTSWNIGVVLLASEVTPAPPCALTPRRTNHQIIGQTVNATGYPSSTTGQLMNDPSTVSALDESTTSLTLLGATWSGTPGSPLWTGYPTDNAYYLRGVLTATSTATAVTRAVETWLHQASMQEAPAAFAVSAL